MGVRFGGYIRVSSVGARDRERFLSPQLQRDRIEGWCSTGGHELVTVHEDLDVSGGKRDREGLLGLVEQVERGELDGIVVARLDRFARSLLEGISLVERIDQADGQFVAVSDGFDTRTPYGRLALNILLSIAQFELERYRETWHESRTKMIEQGRHPGPSPPLGYRPDEDGVLEPDERADLVGELFRRRANGESVSLLARWLHGHGVKSGRGGTPSPQWVSDLIRNRVYLGEVRSGDLVNETAHPPLIDRMTWERARAAVAPRPRRGDGPKAPLSGLLRCHGCRYVMGASKSPYGKGWKRSFRCSGHHSAGGCPSPAFALEEQLTPMVERQFFALVGAMHAAAAGDLEEVGRLQAVREEARHALTVFRDDDGVIAALGASEYAEGLRVRQAAVDRAEAAISTEMASRPSGLPDAASLRMAWPEMDAEAKRLMLRSVFDAVVVSKPKVHRSHSEPLGDRIGFLLRGSLADDIPRPGRNPIAIRSFLPLDDPAGAWVAPL